MIWGPDGKKLSKRHGAASVEEYRDAGYVPEALVNYLALLGWSLDGETTIIPADVLVENFSLDRISKNPAIFDAEKLEWMNGVYLRDMPAEEFVDRIAPWLDAAGLAVRSSAVDGHREWLVKLAPLVQERVKHLDEVAPDGPLPVPRAGRSTPPPPRRSCRRPGRVPLWTPRSRRWRRCSRSRRTRSRRRCAKCPNASARSRRPCSRRCAWGSRVRPFLPRCSSRSSCSARTRRIARLQRARRLAAD